MKSLIIAQGTPFEIAVWDIRNEGPREGGQWAEPGYMTRGDQLKQLIVLHHTTADFEAQNTTAQLIKLDQMAIADRYGLPYNFVFFEGRYPRVFYVNDIDKPWPHTVTQNEAIAVAVMANYERWYPPVWVGEKVANLCGALRAMLGSVIPIKGHQDISPTVCPGKLQEYLEYVDLMARY